MQSIRDATQPNPTSQYVVGTVTHLERQFDVLPAGGISANHFLSMDAYSAAMAFVEGAFTVQGDVFAAIRFFLRHSHSKLRDAWSYIGARMGSLWIDLWPGSKARAQREIQFHYDRSNQFYGLFLDSRMQYSSADYSDPRRSLEEAQLAKLDHICGALDLRPQERFLDVGCGWGGLITHAAERFGALARGCTMSRQQYEFAKNEVEARGLADRVTVKIEDYRDLRGQFDKIASVGMFEHVGRSRLKLYFERMHAMLKSDGLFLNRGVIRPEQTTDGAETLFLQKRVFPGGELAHLSDVVRTAGLAGFEVVSAQDLRLHYARTCRDWVDRLQTNAAECRRLVGETTYRTWLLYLAASAVNFEDGHTSAAELVFAKNPA